MKYRQPLDEVLGSRSKVALLRLLVRTRVEQTGSELARQVKLDVKTCHNALHDLASQGVVEQRQAGAAILYRAKEQHFLVRSLLDPLFDREGDALAEYAKDLTRHVKVPVVSLILFGSVARTEERATSDVDLILVVPGVSMVQRAENAVDLAASELAARYGNPPQVLVMDRDGFRRKAEKGDALVTEVLRTGRVLSGKPFSEVLKHVS